MLGNHSEEGDLEGLNYIKGYTKKITFSNQKQPSILPHMGWNDIIVHKKDLIWTNIDLEQGFYFLHSCAMFRFVKCAILARKTIFNRRLVFYVLYCFV